MKPELNPVITIDGASGTGKGTISRIIATMLGFHLLDSGALYRALALAAMRHNVSLTDKVTLTSIAKHLDAQFLTHAEGYYTVILEGEDVTNTIRTELIGNAASKVGELDTVREALFDRQRSFREAPGLVADGRDMGTVIFPDALLKIMLVASPEERARRRYKQLKDQGNHVTLSGVEEDLAKRDSRDQERAVAPLKPAIDAIIINTDGFTIEEVVQRIRAEIAAKKAFPVISILQQVEDEVTV